MKKVILSGSWLLVVFMLVVSACAPAAAPPAPPAPAPAVAEPGLTPEEAAWAKVVTAAKKEGRVVIYTFGFVGDWGKEVVKGFKDTYGINVEVVGGVGATLMERLKAEQAAQKYVADTYDTAPAFILTARSLGLTENAGDLPVLAQKEAWITTPYDAEKGLFMINTMYFLSYVNTKLVSSEDIPKSYRDLLKPRWKGRKIILAPPMVDPVPIYLYVANQKYKLLGEDYFRSLARQELKAVPTVREIAASTARGEAELALIISMGTMNPLIREGAPLRPVEMEEGVVTALGTGITMVKNAPHPNAARLFLNWLLTPQGQVATIRPRGVLSVRKDVPAFLPEAGRVEAKKTIPLGLEDLIESSRLQRERVVDRLLGLETK